MEVTWGSGEKSNRLQQNQLMLLKCSHTGKNFPGADVIGEHVLVVLAIRLLLKHLQKQKYKPRKNIEILRKNEVKKGYAVEVQNRYAVLRMEQIVTAEEQ